MRKYTNSVITEPADDRFPSLLGFVMATLAMSGRLGTPSPTRHPFFDTYRLVELHVVPHNGGYVANLEFDVPVGQPNILGTPDRSPYPTADEAFLAGARIVCEALTGSRDLPFLHTGDHVIMAVQAS